MKYDIAIIGCGITGAAISLELSKYDCHVVVLEKENDVAMATTKANSAIIHAGYDPLPGTKMARLNVLGSSLIEDLAKKLNFHYQKIGSLVIGRKSQDQTLIDTLFDRGNQNGVPGLKILKSHEEIVALGEKNLNDDIDYALYAPSASIVSPWQMCLAFISNAVRNGVELKRECKVNGIESTGDGYVIKTSQGEIETKYVVNCAGLHADEIHDMVLPHAYDIKAVRGEYYLLDKDQGNLVSHVIFQTPSKLGKGVLVSPTVHGNLIVGPNAADNDDKDSTSVTSEGLKTVRDKAALTTTKINYFDNVRNFSGNRASIPGREDFLIEEEKKGFFAFAGIKSPGLSSSAAFGKELISMLKDDGVSFKEKADYRYYPLDTYFMELPLEEKEAKIKENPLYGRVICRCESITEGEIVSAIHQPVGALSIDGVKRRTNAGMGRCQGGFCGPKVFDILKRELHLSFSQVYQDRTGSSVVVCQTKEEN